MRDGGSGVFDTVHLETDTNMVLHGDTDLGQYLNTLTSELAGKAASGHTHTLASLGAAAANHEHSQYLTAHQSLAGYVPTTRTINGKALSANITLAASDVGAAASSHTHVATDISDLSSVVGLNTVYGTSTYFSVDTSATVELAFAAEFAIVVVSRNTYYCGTMVVRKGSTSRAYMTDSSTSGTVYTISATLYTTGRTLSVGTNKDNNFSYNYLAIG
ncbi:MAG: hypothetical protein NC114_06635 [Ruminococcus flavefaciens]|nr:hypothetical protein [Ruminococcus flavefaciens]